MWPGTGLLEVDVWRAVANELMSGRPVAMAALVATTGSAPGRVGSVMAVPSDASSNPRVPGTSAATGTVGGGPPESQVLRRGTALLAHPVTGGPELLELAHRKDAPNPSGLGCGGDATYALWRLTESALDDVVRLADELASGSHGWWQVSAEGWSRFRPRRPIPPAGLTQEATGWRYLHRAGPRGSVHVIGGGHVALALTALLVPLDFRVTVVEERPGIATFTSNTLAHARIATRYENLAAALRPDHRDYVVLATHDPKSDRRALEALLPVPLAYLGVMGSQAKIQSLLRDRRRPPYLHAPAGLPIGSQTPQEVAVSIAAEMLAVRAASETGPA